MNRFRPFTLISLSFLLLLAAFPALAENPKDIHPSGYVTDLARVIALDTKARLEALCREVEEKTGAQIAVVTVHSLEGDSVENYGVDLYKQLGVGSKRDNRGVLLLVAPAEHKYRIEVGYGLEPVINDARAGDAGRAMIPLLRQGNYSAAIETATWILAKYIADDRGVTLSGQPPARPHRNERGHSSLIGFWGILFLIWIMFSIRQRAKEADAGEEAAVVAGGLGRCWAEWAAVGEAAAALVAAQVAIPVVEDLAAAAEAAAEAVGHRGVGRVMRSGATQWPTCMRR